MSITLDSASQAALTKVRVATGGASAAGAVVAALQVAARMIDNAQGRAATAPTISQEVEADFARYSAAESPEYGQAAVVRRKHPCFNNRGYGKG